MHTVELMEEAVSLAERLGYQVRQEWMGGTSGGPCEFMGRKWVFIDLALSPRDQLDQLLEAIQGHPAVLSLPMHRELREQLQLRRSA